MEEKEWTLMGRGERETSSFDKVKHHFEKPLEAIDKSDFFTMFAERDAAIQELDDILNPPQPIPGYKKVREVATELGNFTPLGYRYLRSLDILCRISSYKVG